ncbi:alanine racemase [Homoserinimonas sp. OAct 916]|uniref:alanine racemase n=1 Tax=Homoserinimonas sp. OAct 916 TaxID=2211450 RepID=UPI00130074A8|nr:alanine racemase [Homoserinimonas sp. OAct 916]
MKRSAIEHNILVMAEYCAAHAVQLSPHGKTTMMPWLFDQQIRAGAWGITAATTDQCRNYRAFGINRILLANMLVDARAIEWVAQELRDDSSLEFICYVDSIQAVVIMEQVLEAIGFESRIDVVVEHGYAGGRTGTRSLGDAVALAERVSQSTHLRLRGISGFEGFFRVTRSPDDELECRNYLRELKVLADTIHEKGIVDGEMIVTAGGSTYFDLVLEHLSPVQFQYPVTVILRSGCYVSHDSVMYEELSPLAARGEGTHDFGRLQPALELWATVWSVPEPGLAIVGFGRRDAPWDHSFPRPLRIYDNENGKDREAGDEFKVTGLHDQHAFLRFNAGQSLAVGDRIVFGVSHPCGAFDKWRWIPVVDDDYTVECFAGTFF